MDDSIVRNVSDNDGKENLIEVKDLKKHFKVSGAGMLHAVDGVNFAVRKGETPWTGGGKRMWEKHGRDRTHAPAGGYRRSGIGQWQEYI